jgi:hypothetical protein
MTTMRKNKIYTDHNTPKILCFEYLLEENDKRACDTVGILCVLMYPAGALLFMCIIVELKVGY